MMEMEGWWLCPGPEDDCGVDGWSLPKLSLDGRLSDVPPPAVEDFEVCTIDAAGLLLLPSPVCSEGTGGVGASASIVLL